MFLEIPRFDTDFLFSTGLSAGLGSNDIGLDRGQGGGGRIVQFQRVGPRVMLVQAQPVVPIEQQATRSSASPSRTRSPSRSCGASPSPPNRTAACSSTPPTSSCATSTAPPARLRPGNYRVDRTRSAFYLPNTKNFPKNTEVDMTLTFVNEQPAAAAAAAAVRPQGPAPIGAAGGGGGGGGFGGGLFSRHRSAASRRRPMR